MLFMPSAAHAEGTSAIPLPVIELKAKTANTAVPPTTAVTVPKASTIGDNSMSNMSMPATGSKVSTQVVNDTSNDVSDSSLARTGADTTRIVGIGMLLTAIGMALLAFTDALDRTERVVRSLLPNRISGK
jgi:hypothetical protein